MGKSSLFYLIDEYTDEKRFYKRKNLKPYKIEQKMLDNCPFEQVIQYSDGKFIYDVLDGVQCYSGHMITLVRRPYLTYDELLNLALQSKEYDERAGAIGLILKIYTNEFEQYLLSLRHHNIDDLPNKKQIIRMLVLVKENAWYVEELRKILNLCELFLTHNE